MTPSVQEPKQISMVLLKELLFKWDKDYGEYPESKYQGYDLWEWINEQLASLPLHDYKAEPVESEEVWVAKLEGA